MGARWIAMRSRPEWYTKLVLDSQGYTENQKIENKNKKLQGMGLSDDCKSVVQISKVV